MTPDEFKAIRLRLGLSQAELGGVEYLDRHRVTIVRYETGEWEIPSLVAFKMETLDTG